VYRKLHK